MPDSIDAVLAYHQRTKHHLHRYAAGPGYLDWATQPDPFLRFEGAPLLPLDEVPVTPAPTYDALFGALPPRPLDRASISQFFYDALALSAWKEIGENRWSLRVNPSSGNLHPTEGYLLTGPIPGLREEAGLYHYAPHEHGLELRRDIAASDWNSLALPPGAFLVGLTSIHWREAWKYGERAFRYCQHDAGHAIAAVAVSAAALGWHVRQIDSLSDEVLSRLLGTTDSKGPEAEHTDVLLLVTPIAASVSLTAEALAPLSREEVVGTPNSLSPEQEEWRAIDEVAAATVKPSSSPMTHEAGVVAPLAAPDRALAGRQIIRQRRSAVRLDAKTSITKETFFRILERLSPQANRTVFAAFPWRPAIHLALFVHRVEGLEPGLYFLLRDETKLAELKGATKSEYDWKRMAEAPETIPLYLLAEADATQAARTIACQQEIASDGAFALGMIADFEPNIREHGAWFYKRLFWETGAIGQMLYLEAEAAGVRGTGIGCFFDDVMHDLLGVKDKRFQSLYHFTVGGPVEDTRLRTAPAYGHRSVQGA